MAPSVQPSFRNSPEEAIRNTIGNVRRRVQTALSRLATSTIPVRESYLLKESQLCGIRFSLGAFEAIWWSEGQELAIYRDQQLIERIAMAPQAVNRAA